MTALPKKPIIEPIKPAPPIAVREIHPVKRSSSAKVAIAILTIVSVVSIAAAVYFYSQYLDIRNDPTKIVNEENNALVSKVGQLMVLPAGETPTVATVTDLAPLKDQPFFANAKIGYKVIIFTNAKRAILYDPTSNRIVELAPLNIGQNGSAPASNTNTP